MPYSPTLGAPTAGHGSSTSLLHKHDKHSPSPPASQPTMNKRDKRRIVVQDRLADIVQTFTENRDTNYRKQLQQYQADINFINDAQLYIDRPLLEPGEDDTEETAVKSTRQQPTNLQNGIARAETLPKTGRHAARFVEEINDALEERDVNLTATVYNFNSVIQRYEKDYLFAIDIAEIEHQRLLRSLRQQLIATVQQRKMALIKEKEKLDIADTNALLHYPNQFNINNSASPGGPQSNRKTRHTRHRLDVDDLDTAINNNANNGKRKRKALADADVGSPGPAQNREAEVSNLNGYKELHSRLDVPHTPSPAYTITRLFTDRELNANLQQSTYEAIASRNFASTNGHASNGNTKRQKPNPGGGLLVSDSLLPTTTTADPTTDLEDNLSTTGPTNLDANNLDIPDLAAAVSMDRTPSQLHHATRSAGRLNPFSNHTSDPRQIFGELAGRHAGADLIGTISSGRAANEKLKKADGDEYQRAPPLSEAEAVEDVRLMEQAIRRLEDGYRGRGEDDEEDDGGGGEEEDGEAGARGGGGGGGGGGTAAGFDRKIVELALGEEMRDWVGPAGFAEG